MAKTYIHPATNRLRAQSAEDGLVSKAKRGLRKKVRKYYVVNPSTNRRSKTPVTMERFLEYVGYNYAVAQQYQLHEVK